jgi:hypothetical protein
VSRIVEAGTQAWLPARASALATKTLRCMERRGGRSVMAAMLRDVTHPPGLAVDEQRVVLRL